jgi:hypothetical protein
VLIDGAEQPQKTPARVIVDLGAEKAKKFEVAVRLPGYKDVVREVNVPRGRGTSVDLSLTRSGAATPPKPAPQRPTSQPARPQVSPAPASAVNAGVASPLFNGRDFRGWHFKDGTGAGWRATGGIISSTGGAEPGRGNWLTTNRTYGDFTLTVEYRLLTPGANSGVALRFPPDGDPAFEGLELQIWDGGAAGGGDASETRTGAIYGEVAPSSLPIRPTGQWNRFDIRCQGPLVQVYLNGVQIHNLRLDSVRVGKRGRPLAERPRSGYIGLQNHTGQIEFRNIQITEL